MKFGEKGFQHRTVPILKLTDVSRCRSNTTYPRWPSSGRRDAAAVGTPSCDFILNSLLYLKPFKKNKSPELVNYSPCSKHFNSSST